MNPKEDRRPRRIPNPHVLDAAEQYFHACMVLDKLPPGSRAGVLPLLQTAAIALELYLKCLGAEDIYVPVEDPRIPDLHRVYAETTRSHRLVDLFQKIPANIQSQLSEAFESTGLGRLESSFEKLLEQFEGLFAASRYPFEKDHRVDCYPLSGLLGLIRFLHKFIEENHANLRESYRS